MSFPRYPKYKASGVEWLGEVPDGWVVCPPKRRMKAAAGGTLIKGSCSDEPCDGLFPGFSASGQNVWLEEYNYDCPAIVLSAVGARCGKAFKADGKWGVVANTHCLFPLRDSDRDYLWYLTNQEDWWEKGGSAQPFVKVSETMARPWVFPPVPEQTAIAEFLDRETGKIDGLVAEQRRLMELLKEKRQAVISHAVTKGLNPHAPMKPSGIEWLGDVPVGWKVTVIKRFSTLQRGHDLTDAQRTEGPYPVVTSGGVSGTHGTFMARGPGVVTGRYGSTGRLFYIDDDYWPHNTSLYVSDFHGNSPRFVWYSLQTVDFAAHSAKAAVPGIDRNDIHVLPVAVPPKDEQTAIVSFLETELAKFDTLTAEAQRAIDLLQERRTALISAAVTGQIDVRPQPRK